MTRYLVSIYRPENYNPVILEDETMSREIDALNNEMKGAGVRVFVGGLQTPSLATAFRRETSGQVVRKDGPYLAITEHIGGFWVLEVSDLNEALDWGRKAAIACRASVEVRPFH